VWALLGDENYDAADEGYAGVSATELRARGVDKIFEEVEKISAAASKEWSLKKALDKMEGEWAGVSFIVVAYEKADTFIVGGLDEIQMILDDQLVKVQSMLASPFVKHIQARTDEWADKLNTLQSIIDNQLRCQQTWQYLEPIFSSPDILKQMPKEGQKFQKVDLTYRRIMDKTNANPSCMKIAKDKDRLFDLEESNVLLEEIEKGLADYLEVKRIAFPRFFFLANDAMLEILSQTKDPETVQPHLGKCFEGIYRLQFVGGAKDIHAIQSVEGEKIPLTTIVKPKEAQGAVEKWLLQVEQTMFKSIHGVCKVGVEAFVNTPRAEWVLQHAGQVVLVVTAIFWTKAVEEALGGEKGALQTYADVCTGQLNDIVGLVRGDLTKLQRATLSALVVMDVHARDVTVDLAKKGIEGMENPFAWQSQLRMYWEQVK
jgi:dynein heavy chain, axonemal